MSADQGQTAISYAQWLAKMAVRADDLAHMYRDLPEFHASFSTDAAIARALAALVEQIEQGNSDDTDITDICNQLAAGYRTDPQEGEG